MKDEKMNESVDQSHQALPERIRTYLNKRCLPDEIINKFKIGWTGRAIAIPIYGKDSEYAFFKFRKDPAWDDSESPKYWYRKGASAELYGWENITNPKPILIICEGEFDRLVLEAKGIPAVTSTGGAGTFKDEWISSLKEISNLYVCFDQDDAGMYHAQRLIEKLPHARYISLSSLPEGKKDITDFFVLGNSLEDFNKLLKEAKTLDELNFCLDSLDTSEVNFLNPSQDFINNKAYFTISVLERQILGKNPFKQIYYAVTNERRLLRFGNEDECYTKYGLLIKQLPIVTDNETRWTNKLIKEYLFKGFQPLPNEVLDKVKNIYLKYCELKDTPWYSVIALWVIGTYFYYLFETYPYLAFEGTKNTGKSKTARISTRISFNGILSVNISDATLYRDIEVLRPTFGIDEAEILKDPEKSKLIRAILNAGHFKGAKVLRQEKTSKGIFHTRHYSVYAPKLIANTRGLEDTLESRTIKIIMLRAKTEKGLILDTESSEDWNYVRHLCYCFTLCYFKEIKEIYLNNPEVKVANNRFNDLWSPLLSIARFIFKDKPDEFKLIKDFALEQIGLSQDDSLDDRTNAFFQALRSLTNGGDRVCSSREIKEAMQAYLEEDEVEPINTKWIGWKLKSFGLSKGKQRLNKGYLYHLSKKDVDDLLERYLEPDYISPGKTTRTAPTTLKLV